VRPMLQALLQDRFALVAHNDTKPMPAFALTAGKHPQLKQADGVGDAGCKVDRPNSAGSSATQGAGASGPVATVAITCHNMTMAAFADGMNNMEGAGNFINGNIVVDQTGLQGSWDFRLTYSGRMIHADAGIVTIFEAVDKQLGLKLEPSQVPMPVVVVDSVNRTPTPDSVEAAKAYPPPPTEFEAAVVKLSDPDTRGVSIRLEPGGRFNIRAATLKLMVKDLWGVTDDMLVGAPKFMDSQGWDIVAKAPEVGTGEQGANYDLLLEMAKTLIQDRFKFAFHYEERPVSAYVLTAPKPKMKKADPNSRTGCKEGPLTLVTDDPRNSNPVANRLFSCRNTTMAYLADQLQWLADGYVHSAVLDSTGLAGGWDFTLNFSSMGPPGGVLAPGSNGVSDPNGAISLPEAMEKQLGLKMELVKRPVQVLVIDHIEQKPTDN
jgi:uncharacterized protein (TIGR03435 family)